MPLARYHLTVLALLAFVSAGASPASRPAAQPNMVKTIKGTILHDAARDKDLPVTIRIPPKPGPHPLIVFSHGAGGSGDNYVLLLQGWANRGYVVISPTHADSIALMAPEKRRAMKPRDVVVDAVTDVKGWQDRAKDISFVLDSLDDLEKRIPELAGKIDRDHIGVGGHSYGAMTATILAGGKIRTKVGGELKSFADPRVKAAVVMSGQGEGQMGFTEDSWSDMKLPLMVMTGSQDTAAMGQGPKWRKAPFARSPAGGKYWVYIDGATHMSFSGRLDDLIGGIRRAGDDRPQPDGKAIWAVITRASNTFWDAYLKDDVAAKELLQSDAIPRDATVGVEYERR
jgi:predicted dienelactone hydrolase